MKSSREFISLGGGGGLSKWLSWGPVGCQIPRRLHSCICGYPCSRDGQQQAGPSPELCCVTRDSPEPALRTRALSGPEGMGHLACMWLNHPNLLWAELCQQPASHEDTSPSRRLGPSSWAGSAGRLSSGDIFRFWVTFPGPSV